MTVEREAAPLRMTREEWHRWSEGRSGRTERVGGEVVAMSPERVAHARIKGNIFVAFRNALAGNAGCVALPDGATVEVDDGTDYEPDAVIHCGAPIPDDSLTIPTPVVVVEVVSPSSLRIDTLVKLGDYFRVPSVQHYLVVRTDRREVMHYTRGPDGGTALTTRISGSIPLDPPGITVRFEDVYD